MDCVERERLETAWHSHREAALFLACTKDKTHQRLLMACRADQARAKNALTLHRRDCASCCAYPIRNWIE